MVQRGRQIFAGVLRRGIDSGAFRNVDVDQAVRLILAPVLMAAVWKHSFLACEREGFPVGPYLETSIDVYLRGIAAHGAGVSDA